MNEPDLRPMFSYSLSTIIFVIILIGIVIFFLVRKKKENITKPVVILPEVKNIYSIKGKYRLQLNELQQEIEQNKISTRKAYQKLSSIIRNFIFEMTHIKVQNYSLAEIRRLKMSVLTALVEEYYDPEFSKESNGDILQSLEKTRQVMERWN